MINKRMKKTIFLIRMVMVLTLLTASCGDEKSTQETKKHEATIPTEIVLTEKVLSEKEI